MKDISNILTNKHKKNQSKGVRKENSSQNKQLRRAASSRPLSIIYPNDKLNLQNYKAILHSHQNKQDKTIDKIYDLSLSKKSLSHNKHKEIKHFGSDHKPPTNVSEFFSEEIKRQEKLRHLNLEMKRLYDRGIAQRYAGDYDGAVKTFEKIIDRVPRNITGYNSRGYTNMCRKRYDQAMKDFIICINISPRNEVVLLNKAKTHLHLKEYEEALKDYETLIRLLPDDSRGYNGKGVCLRKLGFEKSAIEYFTKSIELGTHPNEPRTNRGLVYSSENKPEKAIMDFNYLIKSSTNSSRNRRILTVLRDRNVNQIKRNAFFPQNPTQGWHW